MSTSHDSAHLHVQGKSEFVDDRPLVAREVFVGIVYSSIAKGKIKKILDFGCFKLPGVVGVYSAKDVYHNIWGTIFQDQPLLADTQVSYVGEPILVVAAETQSLLKKVLNTVRVEFIEENPILSIQQAISAGSFIGGKREILRGDLNAGFRKAKHVIEDEIQIAGADHFYLESQACIVYPKEDGILEIHSSSQHPTEVQHVVCHGLGIPSKDVTVIVKRLGGGFGGKESQAAPFAFFAALVAQKTGRAARLVISKDDDMIMTGKRNPFFNKYKVGFDSSGLITALDVALYSDGGAFADLSTSIMERAMLHIDNAYYLPNIKVTGQVCRTNYHPHTAFRGFGGPKGVATIEKIIEQIAHQLELDPLDVRKLNTYQVSGEQQITHYGQKVENNCLPRLFESIEKKSEYRRRRLEIDLYNKEAIAGKHSDIRGLSIVPVKFGISFTTRFLNQGSSLVIIHRDGSIQASTGATEMGQGVNARIAEIIGSELGLTRSCVQMMATRTDKNANTSPTAASSGTDINGAAALIAARRLKNRLSQVARQLFNIPEAQWASQTAGLGTAVELTAVDEKIDSDNYMNGENAQTGICTYHGIVFEDGFAIDQFDSKKRISFKSLCNEAYLNRISLSEYAHFRIPHLDFNKLTGKGNAFLYFTQGVACSEVKIDLMTGELKVARTDILMDLGRPVNRDLDVGQVCGAFVQGLGWVTTENLFYSQKGKLLSHSPSTYKIPSIQDVPRIFNIDLINNNDNVVNVRRSKAVGEPPLLLALSVWTAAQNALTYLPKYSSEFPSLSIPATAETILRSIWKEGFDGVGK